MITRTPDFPRFKTLRIDDFASLSLFVNQFPIYSDFNVISLLTWGVNNSVQYSFLNNNLVIRLRDYNTKQLSYSVLGANVIARTFIQLAAACSLTQLERIPEIVIEKLEENEKPSFIITPARDEDDYVYNLEDLARLRGPDYRKFRRSLSNFHSKNDLQPVFMKINNTEMDMHMYVEMLNLTKKWRVARTKNFEDTSFEYYAIRRALHYAAQLPVDMWVLIERDNPLGFIITENINEHTVLHFEKTDISVPGVGSYLKHNVFKALHESGQQFLNYEQDLGIAGLREAKLALRPVGFMKKYSVTVKT